MIDKSSLWRVYTLVLNVRGLNNMRLLLCAVLTATLFPSSCMALGSTAKRSDDDANPVGRIEALTKNITRTMSEVSADVLPILGAMGQEVLLEAKSDAPKVAEELRSQATHLSSLRKSRQSTPRRDY